MADLTVVLKNWQYVFVESRVGRRAVSLEGFKQ